MASADPTPGTSQQTGPTGMARQEEVDLLRERLEDLRKEYQEFREVVEERERLKDRMWKERIGFISIIVALGVALITQTLPL